MKRNIIGLAILAVVILFLALWGPAACQKMRSLAFQNKVNTEQGKAFGNSAADAVRTQGEVNRNQAASEDQTRANTKEIKNAQGATDPVNPVVRDAGLRSICARASARNSERCRLFNADRSRLEGRRPVG